MHKAVGGPATCREEVLGRFAPDVRGKAAAAVDKMNRSNYITAPGSQFLLVAKAEWAGVLGSGSMARAGDSPLRPKGAIQTKASKRRGKEEKGRSRGE